MSSTNRANESRNKFDFYETPAWCVHRLLDRRPDLVQDVMYDPCCGTGAIPHAIASHSASKINRRSKSPRKCLWHVSDINADFLDHMSTARELASTVEQPPGSMPVRIGDAAELSIPNGCKTAITNPPFFDAVRLAQSLVTRVPVVVFLLRLNWLGTAPRHPWLSENMPNVYVLPDRAYFSLNKAGKIGSDSVEYAWFVWDNSGLGRYMKSTSGTIELLDLTPRHVRSEQKQQMAARFRDMQRAGYNARLDW